MTQTTPNSQNFPQFSQAKPQNRFTAISKTQIEDYKISPAVQNRPAKIVAIEKEEYGIRLTFSTLARSAILSYTHETALHLYNPAETTVEKLYLHIHLWSDYIFRIIFSKDKHIANPFVGLPEDAQMLIGKPENVNFRIDETIDEITITTNEIQITINKETTLSSPNKCASELFVLNKDLPGNFLQAI